MKFTLIALILFYTSSLAAQDNVEISYESPEGRDRIINELNDVKILEIISNDKEALDKKFTLQIVRYQEGKPDTVFTNGTNCDIVKIPVVMANGDSALYIHEPCKSLTYKIKKQDFKITLAGKLQDSTFKMSIHYPYGSSSIVLDAQPGFVLQNPFSDDKRNIKTNTPTPVALYFGGYKQGNSTFYCLAKTAKSEEMYQKFQVADYYVFYLTIKD
ncbi:MAG: hypothetical protein ACJAXV_001033 [Bacteroidia bacterium]|jgi:hypothetical protein|tara:strand:+ start:206 stop:850 length:645 start_codon:yes stop_codon:yes gene_type:complete